MKQTLTKPVGGLKITQADLEALRQYERDEIIPSTSLDKAFRYFSKEAERSRLGDPTLYYYVRFDETRKLNEPKLLRAIHAAAERDDRDFFAELVRLFTMPLVTPAEIRAKITPLEWFLLCNWVQPNDPLACSLCYYSEPALLKYLQFQADNPRNSFPKLSPDTLYTTWTRLGLKKAKTLLFRNVKIERGATSAIPFLKFRQ